jgi:tetratricopeptide (TPR) repeat protein
MFNALAENGESHYNGGKMAEAEMILRKSLKLANTTNLRSRSAQKHNDAILGLASIYSEQAKFSETKEILAQLFSLSKVDLLPWEVQQKIKASHLLAMAYLELKELNEAEKCCQGVMARRRTFGKNSPDYKESLKLLLVIHESQGMLNLSLLLREIGVEETLWLPAIPGLFFHHTPYLSSLRLQQVLLVESIRTLSSCARNR